jgi:ribonucleoside-diphosphate reductase alpha chain
MAAGPVWEDLLARVRKPGQPAILDPSFRLALSESARYLLALRYLARLPDGQLETPEALFRRVARFLAGAERCFRPSLSAEEELAWAELFFQEMTAGRYLPNAPALLAAARAPQQMAACFVLPVEDSIDGIFQAVRQAAIVHARGGGTGFSFSALRPAGSPVASGGFASGPVAFLRVFDAETEVVKRGGTGWGANMAVLDCDHPDIRDFVRAKSAPGIPLRNFNLSVGVTDDFMARLDQGEAAATELFDLICEEAWKTGDPGLLFLDRINADNPTPALGRIEATNPCGEAPLLPYESCCLGALNVARFAEPRSRTLRWDDLSASAAIAVRMMDNLVEANPYPLPEIREATLRTRKLGIGVMGFADLLLLLRIPYDSVEAEDLAGRLMGRIRQATREASVALAAERGSFPAFPASVWPARGYPHLRNATTTSNAPNSTISVIAGCSAGIEPLYSLALSRRLATGDTLTDVHEGVLALARNEGFYSEALERSLRQTGTLDGAPGVPAEFRRLLRTAHQIAPEWHVRVQAAFQRFTDLGVSKTINLPHEASPADIAAAFRLAYRLGCKGVTCFRDGCREDQFLTRPQSQNVSNPCPPCLN